MDIHLTFDYELYFGQQTGSVQKCMVEPTDLLLDMSEKYTIPMTFFIDTHFLIRLNKFKKEFPELENDWLAIKNQLNRMARLKCSIELHIHPHWERSFFNGKNWICNTKNNYKLADFEMSEAKDIVEKNIAFMQTELGVRPTAFRAGGWCIEPFSLLKESFKTHGIRIDSTVMPRCKFFGGEYSFDFSHLKQFQKIFQFEDSTSIPTEMGHFTEVPIATARYSPIFSWMNYITGRLFPKTYKPYGDGTFISQPGKKRKTLTQHTWNHASLDGYYSKRTYKIFKLFLRKNASNFVIIAHPKGMTPYSMNRLEKFILKTKNKHTFKCIHEIY
jgi:hypothetical protein